MGIDLNRFKGKRDKEWLDWLEDDPVPASIRNRIRENAVKDASQPVVRRVGQSQPQQAKSEAKEGEVKHISVNIQLPSMDKLKTRASQTSKRIKRKTQQHRRVAIGMAAVVIISLGAFAVVQTRGSSSETGTDTPGVLSEKTEKPTFEYSLPKGEESNATGEVRYDSEKKVVNFQDSIGGVAITISQQPLPTGFEDDTDAKVKRLAEDFSAKEVLATANPTAYLGTSAKGPQTVVFAKKNLLVFIQSAKEIDNNDWAEYITNLK